MCPSSQQTGQFSFFGNSVLLITLCLIRPAHMEPKAETFDVNVRAFIRSRVHVNVRALLTVYSKLTEKFRCCMKNSPSVLSCIDKRTRKGTNVSPPQRGGAVLAPLFEGWAEMARQLYPKGPIIPSPLIV